MDDLVPLLLECRCGTTCEIFYGLFLSPSGEILVKWRCRKCEKDCLAILAGVIPSVALFTEDDAKFLHSCNVKMEAEDA